MDIFIKVRKRFNNIILISDNVKLDKRRNEKQLR